MRVSVRIKVAAAVTFSLATLAAFVACGAAQASVPAPSTRALPAVCRRFLKTDPQAVSEY